MPQVHQANDVRLECDVCAKLGESPSWDAQNKRLLSVDINNKRIFNPETKQHATIQLKEMVGAVMPTTQTNTLLAALERNIALVDFAEPSNPKIRVLASTPEADGLPADGWRFNDAKVAPGGTFIAGRMHKGWRDGNPGRMCSFAPDAALRQIMEQDSIELPNGMAWDMQKRIMFFSDTAANAIYSYPTDADGIPNGGQRQTAFKTDDPPDGITIDADGNIWAALAEFPYTQYCIAMSVRRLLQSGGSVLAVPKLAICQRFTFDTTEFDFLQSEVSSELIRGRATRPPTIRRALKWYAQSDWAATPYIRPAARSLNVD